MLVGPFGTVDGARPAATLELARRALASLGSSSPLPRTARRRPCAQSAPDFPAPFALSPHRGEVSPRCARSRPFSGGRSARTTSSGCWPSRPSARLSSFRSTRSRTWMAAWPLRLAPGTAAVAVERVSRGGRATGSRRSPGRAQRRIRSVSTVRRRPRRSATPSGSCAHRPGVVHNRTWRAYGVPLKMGGRGRERRLSVSTQVLCLELLMEIG